MYPSAIQTGQQRMCSQCKVETVVFPVARCKPCNTIYNRVLQCKKVMDGSCIQAFDAMDKDKKLDFYNTCRDLTGQHLKGFMKQYIDKEVTQSFQTSLAGTGNFLDEDDLRDKYKNKPEQWQTNYPWHSRSNKHSSHARSPRGRPKAVHSLGRRCYISLLQMR